MNTSCLPRLEVREIVTRAVSVPLRQPLRTRVAVLENVPLVLVDVITEQGIVGRAYLVAYLLDSLPLYRHLLTMIETRTRGAFIDPPALLARLQRDLTLLGHAGLTLMALSVFDMACWDALARAQGVPLHRLLGSVHASVPAYNSNGLGLQPPAALRDELPGLLMRGFTAVKLRLGHATLAEDLRAVEAVCAALPRGTRLMSDFNQCLTTEDAIRRGRALDDFGLEWLEEPVRYDDFEGCAQVAANVRTPIQIGENFYGPQALGDALRHRAASRFMPDLQRIGGVSGWRQAATIAQSAQVPLSSHLLPEFSAHVLAATPGAHWLEYVDWAEPILREPLRIEDGRAWPGAGPGVGLEWNEDEVSRHALSS